jgi:peroxiredoxin
MLRTPPARRALVLLSCLILGSTATPAWAQQQKRPLPTVEQMLSTYRPRQPGVVMSTPRPEEYSSCEVRVFQGKRPGSTGYLLLDAQKRPVRRYFDSNGDEFVDVWSYYKDGVEVYREIDTNFNKIPDQYRWLHSGGIRWGLDPNEDGKIDVWKQISPEEVAQELFQAAVTHDVQRLNALLITENEIRALPLSTAEANRIREARKNAQAKFQNTINKLPALNDKAQWVRLESDLPQCIPADVLGGSGDVIRFQNRAILFENNKQHDWIQTGEMIEVAPNLWRLVDGPAPGDTMPLAAKQETTSNPELQKLLEALAKLDESVPPAQPAPNAAVRDYNEKRAKLVVQIVSKADAKDQEAWIKQLADNYSTWAQNSLEKDRAAFNLLSQLKTQVAKSSAGSSLAGYVTFREMWAEFARPLLEAKGNDLVKVQEQWMGKLQGFVEAYPKAEDTPDALMHLAMGNEYGGKDKEEVAKRYYQQLFSNFPVHPGAAKAKGALRRLTLEGQPFELAGPKLDGGTFNIAQFKGKVVVVYYWASDCQSCPADFARLKQLQTTFSAKGVEVVGVNLDDTLAQANQFLKTHGIGGIHLFQAAEQGGMNSPLATQYGVMGLPHLFLIGRDGRVISRSIQITELEEALNKAN